MKYKKIINGKIFALLFACFVLFSASIANAQSVYESVKFNIDENYDSAARTKVSTVLIKTTQSIYFYVEKTWWDSQVQSKKDEILFVLDSLSREFEGNIYPVLTSIFGTEWKPGIDGDPRITILFHSMKEDAGGYFRTADEYLQIQVPTSNEKEMVYLPLAQIDNPKLKVLLAHELMHLITFNQKNKKYDVNEEDWLNEARADYSSTILGYDNAYEGSNLQKRVQAFLEKPTDSLVEWLGKKYDYGAASMFSHYLVDHYGISILIDSLKTKEVGIASINYALKKNNFDQDFSQVFTNWTIASTINDCSINSKYCYLNEDLKSLKINPVINFLPLSGSSSLSVTNVTKNWAGNWQKVIGGNGNLTLDFSALAGLNFKIPYIVYDNNNNYKVNFLQLDENQKGKLEISNFGSIDKSLVILPSLQTKMSGFDGSELTYPFTFVMSVNQESSSGDQALIQKLLDQIEALKKEIERLKNNGTGNTDVCSYFGSNLYYGLMNNSNVECLQKFLKNQGVSIYPEGYITGNFGGLTKQAVIKFQEKYASEILTPVGLSKGTGFVGEKTRQKINELLSV